MKAFTIITLAFSAALPTVLAECCVPSWIPLPETPGWYPGCLDNTAATPCCATGLCDVFCCNCDGSCRRAAARSSVEEEQQQGRRGLDRGFFQHEEEEDLEAFAVADAAGHGNLTLDEYLKYMGVEAKIQMWVEYFNKFDANGDGVLTEDEVFLR